MENSGRWLEARFVLNEMESDVLVALLSELPFNSFMEDGTEKVYTVSADLISEMEQNFWHTSKEVCLILLLFTI